MISASVTRRSLVLVTSVNWLRRNSFLTSAAVGGGEGETPVGLFSGCLFVCLFLLLLLGFCCFGVIFCFSFGLSLITVRLSVLAIQTCLAFALSSCEERERERERESGRGGGTKQAYLAAIVSPLAEE